jgi:uncharacterized protein (TIGR02266 family)
MSDTSKQTRLSDDDRRESPRVPMRFLVRRAGSEETFESREGNLSLGGFAWYGSAFENGQQVEVRFVLPGGADEVQARGEIIHVRQGDQGVSAHVRFVELSVEVEMAIARYLDDLKLAEPKEGSGA